MSPLTFSSLFDLFSLFVGALYPYHPVCCYCPSRYGNYVLQRAVAVAESRESLLLCQVALPHLSGPHNALRNAACGRRLLNRISSRFPHLLMGPPMPPPHSAGPPHMMPAQPPQQMNQQSQHQPPMMMQQQHQDGRMGGGMGGASAGQMIGGGPPAMMDSRGGNGGGGGGGGGAFNIVHGSSMMGGDPNLGLR